MTHEVFSIVAPVRRESSERLKALLAAISAQPGNNGHLPFENLPMVHFASFVVFSNPVQAHENVETHVLPELLVFESCIDGPIDDYIEALLHHGLGWLHDAYSCCQGYEARETSADALRRYLLEHVRRPHLLHIGNPGLRVEHIKSSETLRRVLDGALDDVVARRRTLDPPLELMRGLREALNVPPSTRRHWFFDDPKPQEAGARRFAWFADQQSFLRSRLRHWGKLIALLAVPLLSLLVLFGWGLMRLYRSGGVAAALGAVLVLAAAAGLFWRWLKRGEKFTSTDVNRVREIRDLEDRGVQNKMASLVILKSGWFQWLVARAVLGLFNLIYRTWFTDVTPGRLKGLQTIHFGHWTLLDLTTENKTRQKGLMFLSNYDGSWETYLDDFLATVFHGVVAIWGHAVRFPDPLDGPAFKAFARTRMSRWAVWYQAYPDLTVANIENNDQIRKGLIDLPPTDDGARLWLSRFGSIKNGNEYIDPPADELQTAEIQGLVLSGYGHLPYGAYLLLHIDDPRAARDFLATLSPEVTDARPGNRDSPRAVNIAFTQSGLRQLGLDAAVLARFPLAFQEGIAPKRLGYRSRALGDVGDNDPGKWEWGGTAEEHLSVDMLVIVFAGESNGDGQPKDSKVKEAACGLVDRFTSSGAGRRVQVFYGTLFGDGQDKQGQKLFREHFGFADGISQPEIEGSHRATTRVGPAEVQNLVKPGEFLLGYVAGDGTVTPGVPVEARLDAHGLLPPDGSGNGLREFGRNGTFLVFRQLQQDVGEFRKFVSAGAASPSPQDADEFAARLVGRRPDGSPLVARSDAALMKTFDFSSDPNGFACPIGAHIRRANPRDSLSADSAAARQSANRHRLLRRGRPYGEPVPRDSEPDNRKRGMLFICLNADIERQFEFVQQNWINNPVFGGLAGERDPLIGACTAASGSLTVQAPTVRRRVLDIRNFVTVKGGGYFFLPSLSAIRYLATLDGAEAAGLAAPGPMPDVWAPTARTQPTRLRRALVAFERALPNLRLVWAARFPLLLAAVLVLWPVLAASSTSWGSHFLIGGWGLVVVSALASVAAFVVMITLRLVLLYGWRSRPGPPRWTGSARWSQVLGFQALALPLVIAAIHLSALDSAGVDGRSYWELVLRNAVAAGTGMLAALVILGLATSLQALRPNSRADLFFPSNPLARRLAGPGRQRLRSGRISLWLTRVSRSIVNSVPKEIGIGYIDYRRSRILPGHVFAASLAFIVCVIYVVGYVLLNPAWDWSARWTKHVPVLAYLTFILIVFGWLLSLLAFFFDRYGIPTLLPLVLWIALVASVARTDHFYRVLDVVQPPSLTPADIVRRAKEAGRADKVIVVASEGRALTSSAWTAEVLTALAGSGGRRFTDSLRLVSASSGAALGTMYFLDAYDRTGFPLAADGTTVDAGTLARIRDAARQPSDNENAWGLVYPDLVRTFAPILVPGLLDRGWAMEQAWKRRLSVPDATLNGWRGHVAAGWLPATAFGVTLVETGGRYQFATYDANPCVDRAAGCPDRVTHRRDLPIVTTARLASTFPYVSPVSRAQVDAPAYHVTDGGFWDNFGIVAALEWLDQASSELASTDVMLIEIKSSPLGEPLPPEERAWTFELLGPMRAMNAVRTNAQQARSDLELKLFKDQWASSGKRPLAHTVFRLSDPEAKLSWRIGRRDIIRMEHAWTIHDNQTALAAVRSFLGLN
jgi:Dyp-type peroxidase family